jgi:RNA polymerase sigma-70 factor (ECF subfamily)
VATATDQELLDRWRGGDNVAGNELLSRYFGPVRRFFATKISGDDVKDLVQRTFAGCVEGAQRFRGDGSFRAFILAIARRQLYKYLRDKSRHNAREDADLSVSSVVALGQSPSSVIAAEQREALLLQALQRIPVEQQTLLELHYWERLPAAELAQVLDIEPGAVRVRLHRARRAVEKVLSELVGPHGEPVDVETTARVLGLAV